MSYPEPGQPGAYQAYPGGPGPLPGPGPKPPLPSTVRNAFYLMIAGAVLSVLSLITGLGSKSAMRTAVQNASPNLTADQVNTAVNFGYALIFLVGLIGAGLWVWMAYMNKAGRNWARITGTVFFGIDTLTVFLGMGQHTATGSSIGFGVVVWLIGLATVILIWNKSSSEYYKPPMQFGAAPYGGGYPLQ
ncbi:MAG TPA: hypothetical protein VGX23_09995 [Actinocrinis sp.]|nr:hypothetical protein [Actinocrinis sp.]